MGMPHNLVFNSILEMAVFGGFQDPLEGSWGDWLGQKYKKYRNF